MIFDAENLFSNKQDLNTVSVKTASTDAIKVGAGNTVHENWFTVIVNQAITAGSATTVTVALETDDTAAFSSPKTLYSVALNTPVAVGTPIQVRIPQGVEGYLRAAYTPGAALTGGKVTAGLFVDTDLK